ncbi:MAG: hypothetical protein E7354_00975 [Clostridiales bacterium]|nr:hypothetical protein [Clostridiales bacterium]
MKLARKIVSIGTIVATAWVVLQLILLLLGMSMIGGMDLFGTVITLAIGGFFAINSLNMISKNKIIGMVSLALIAVSVVLIILSFWISIGSSLYQNLTISFGLLSVLFNIIVSSGLDLGKSNLVVQIIVYALVSIVDIMATLGIFGAINLGEMIVLFVILILLCILGIVVLKVLAKRMVSKAIENDANMVKITKQEYMVLVDKAKKYDELMSKANSINEKSE